MFIQNIIANKFYEHFENELYDFTFTYKTEASVNNTTIIELCEEAVCAAHGISHQQYLDEETDVAYDEIFGDAANMTEQVINIMLQKFMEQHNGT
jgi:hypothetical protein